jgi:hypothetical protein
LTIINDDLHILREQSGRVRGVSNNWSGDDGVKGSQLQMTLGAQRFAAAVRSIHQRVH